MVNDLEHFHFYVKVKKKQSLNKNAFSSRIRTARLFTVSRSTRGGGVSAPRVDVCPEGGGCLPGGRKVSAQGVSAHGEGCLPRGGVSA